MRKRKSLERALILAREMRRRKPWVPQPGPQTMAFNSAADIIGFGGSAGGGKTDLIVGTTLCDHQRALIVRREKAQTEGIVQRIEEITGDRAGYNSQKSAWRVRVGKEPLIEFGGLDNPGDERRWQGRPHDLKALDEVTEIREAQARFIMGWARTSDPEQRVRVIMTFNPPTTTEGRWVVKFFAPWLDSNHPNPAQPGELRWFTTIGDNEDYEVPDGRPFILADDGSFVYDFDPVEHDPEDVLRPKSRTFIPARVTDNRYYMESGYMSQLQALPEPLRSQMLYGDFQAGTEDDPWQVIPTAWLEAALERWRRPARLDPMDSMGVDVAMGGRDNTVIARRHGMWFDEPITYTGKECRDGPTIAGYCLAAVRNGAHIHIDLFGVGAQPYGHLMALNQPVIGVNVGDPATGVTEEGSLPFFNLRSQLWWRMREALDPAANTGIALPPDKRLKADLLSPKWSVAGRKIKVEGREDIVKRLGRSPDFASAYILALIDTPRMSDFVSGAHQAGGLDYDPYKNI